MCRPVSRQSRFSLIFFLQQEPGPEPEPRARIRFRFFLGQNDMVPAVPVPVPAPVPQHCAPDKLGLKVAFTNVQGIMENAEPVSTRKRRLEELSCDIEQTTGARRRNNAPAA